LGEVDAMTGAEPGSGVVTGDQAVLDLSHLTSPDELATISRIEGVGAVIVPEALASAYLRIPTSGVGGTVFVPDGAKVRVHTGTLTVGGEGLGAADDILVVVGLLIVATPVTGQVPSRIHVIGMVLAPRGSESVLGASLAGGTGTVLYYRHGEDQDIKVLTGQVKVSAALLANRSGGSDDLLVAAGQVIVSGPVEDVGFRQVLVAGQLVAPAASRDALEPRLQVVGQMVWYLADDVRVIYDDTRISPDFFGLLDRPVSLVLFGDVVIEAGTTTEMVRQKVRDIVLFSTLTAPPDLVPVLQVLTTEAFGTIRAADGPQD
jgi:hypothetical protein